MLAVARTITSLNRLLDVLPALADDSRVEVVFTVDPGSAYGGGVAPYLAGLGARVVAWDDVPALAYDLAIAASDNGDLSRIASPLLLVPHGAGYHKLARPTGAPAGDGPSVSGLARAAVGRPGRTLRLVLSHEAQRPLVATVDPGAARTAIVAGDPCLDRLHANHARRERCRAALGVAAHQRLVAVTSTWGRRSAFGRHPDLVPRALAELPYDEYRVAACLHPNVWAYHGALQLRHWLERAGDAGLSLLPPTGAWQMGLLAADCVVGDHGSLSAYALDLGLPVLLAAFGEDEVVPDSAMADLGRNLPRLDGAEPLAAQVDKAIAGHDPAAGRALVDGVFARRGRSLAILRATMYELMGLRPPPWAPRHRPVPEEPPPRHEPTAFHVEASVPSAVARRDAPVTLRRFPAVVADFGRHPGRRHLAVDADEPDAALVESASVLVRRGGAADRWSDATLARYPGCRVAAVVGPGGDLVADVRDRGRVRARLVGATPGFDSALVASAVYARLVADRAAAGAAMFEVRSGVQSATVVLEPADHPG